MAQMGERGRVCRFGAYELDLRGGELRKHGVRIKLQEQPRQILILLLEEPGEVVARDQIQKRLWPDGTFVDFDNAINSAVRKLREALNDTAENPRFVETLARRGYRFVAPASMAEANAPAADAVAASETGPAPAAAPARRWRWVLAAAVTLVIAIVISAPRHTSSAGAQADIRVAPLTSNPGVELQPSFSPDGASIAYAWDGMDAGNFGIYTKLVGAGDPVRITRDVARDFSPAWSPDGRWVAALRDFGRENAVILIPASGGQPRELARIAKTAPDASACLESGGPHICGFVYFGQILSWSADARYLFTSGLTGKYSPYAIIRISAETGEQSTVTSPPAGTGGDFGGAVSPDGRSLAFVRLIGAKTGDIYVMPLSGASPAGRDPRRVTQDGRAVESLAWTADGRELIFSSDRAGRRELWRTEISGAGVPRRLSGMGESGTDVAVSPDGRRLVYSRGSYTGSLWKVRIDGKEAGTRVRVTASTARDKFSHISPDGKRIAFQSGRSGVDEIWWCDADGGNPTQLTNFGKGMSGSPRWSPDGQTIAFDSNFAGIWDVYLIGVRAGSSRRLTNSRNGAIPSWSRDGRWVYFTSTRTGRNEIWKIHPDGSSETQVTQSGGFAGAESMDGRSFYYTVDGVLWKMPLGGGPSAKVLSSVSGRIFTVTSSGIYHAAADPAMELRFLDSKRGRSGGSRPSVSLGRRTSRRTNIGRSIRSLERAMPT